jgi:hypothetical protein
MDDVREWLALNENKMILTSAETRYVLEVCEIVAKALKIPLEGLDN